jgi:hypothetical protein
MLFDIYGWFLYNIYMNFEGGFRLFPSGSDDIYVYGLRLKAIEDGLTLAEAYKEIVVESNNDPELAILIWEALLRILTPNEELANLA